MSIVFSPKNGGTGQEITYSIEWEVKQWKEMTKRHQSQLTVSIV